MASLNEQLEAMCSVTENWDGYDAAPPPPSVIELARELAGLIERILQHQEARCVLHVSPTRTGGVLIEWQSTSAEHEVEISADGPISFLHRQCATGQIETRQLGPEPGVVQTGFLHELRTGLGSRSAH